MIFSALNRNTGCMTDSNHLRGSVLRQILAKYDAWEALPAIKCQSHLADLIDRMDTYARSSIRQYTSKRGNINLYKDIVL